MAGGGLSIVGYAIGGPIGGLIGMLAGRWIDVNVLNLYPKIEQKGPRLSDLQVQISSYGAPIPRIWGGDKVAGNLMWSTPIRETQYTESEGGCITPEAETTNYEYHVSLAIGLCAGPITGVLRVWADTKLIYDRRADNTHVVQSPALNMRVYLGDETQTPDPTIAENETITPAFRGLAYVVIIGFPLHEYGNRIPSFTFEVAGTDLAEGSRTETVDHTADVNGSDSIGLDPFSLYLIIEKDRWWVRINTVTGAVERTTYVEYVGHNNGFGYCGPTYIMAPGSRHFRLNADTFDLYDQSGLITGAATETTMSKIGRFGTGYLEGDVYIYYLTQDRLSAKVSQSSDYDHIYTRTLPVEGQMIAVRQEIGYVLCCSSGTGLSYIVRISASFAVNAIPATLLSVTNMTRICYDAASDQFIVGNPTGDVLAFLDGENLSLQATLTGQGLVGEYTKSSFRQGPVGGYLYLVNGTTLNKIDVANHSVAATYTMEHTIGGGCVYDSKNQAVWFASQELSGAFVKVSLNRVTGSAAVLGDIVSDICEEVGLTDVDVADLTDEVKGFRVDDRMTARAAIEALQAGFFFDAADTDGLLQFVPRNSAAVVSIPEADLGAHLADSQAPQALVTTRAQERELPLVIDVEYIDQQSGYKIGLQREQRSTEVVVGSELQVTLRLPMVLTANEARQIAAKHMALAWISRDTYQLAVGRKYARLNPADVITVIEDGNTHQLRIEQIRNKGGIIELDCTAHDQAAYVSTAEGSELPADDDTVDYPGPTILEMIDCPLLTSSTNTPGFFLAALGYLDGWRGAVVYKSNGGIWDVFSRPTRDAVAGRATTVLADVADPNVWDEGGSVNVLLRDSADTLSTATEADVLNGTNLAIVGDEIISFRTATLEADGSYTLTGLLRGRFGTGHATGTHTASDRFVMLIESLLHFVSLDLGELGQERTYRAVSVGMDFASGIDQAFTCQFRNLMPLAPVHLAGTRDGSNNLTITWIRRTRIGGEWVDGQDVPLGESAESYSIDVLDGPGGSVLRTLTATSETVEYSAANQTTDGLTPGDPVTVVVYQISSLVGRGFGTEATI